MAEEASSDARARLAAYDNPLFEALLIGKSLRKRKTTNEGRSVMPRVLVITDDAEREILLDELVNPEHLGSGHSAEQLVERLAWSIEDATQAEAQGRTHSHASPRSPRARARSK